MKRESSATGEAIMAIYKYAGFWRRFVAYTIDNIIINIVFLILAIIITTAFILGSVSGGDARAWIAELTDPARMTSFALLVVAFYIFLSIVYFTYFHGIKGRTPGKMLLGLQVLSAEGTPILFTIPLGFIWAAFDKRKQGWHDKIAGTVVIIRHEENEAGGLIITESQAASTIPSTNEEQSKTSLQSPVPTNEPTADENRANADQTRQ